MDYLDYKYADDILTNDKSEANKWKRKFLIARSKLGITTDKAKVETPMIETPHKSFGTRRIGVGGGNLLDSGTFYTMEHRFALHEFLDPTIGHNPDSTVEMGSFNFKYLPKDKLKNNKSSFQMENFTFIQVISLSPLEKFMRGLSWRVFIGGETLKEKFLYNKFVPKLELGGGVSQYFGNFLYYLFLNTKALYSDQLKKNKGLVAMGPELTFIYRNEINLNR